MSIATRFPHNLARGDVLKYRNGEAWRVTHINNSAVHVERIDSQRANPEESDRFPHRLVAYALAEGRFTVVK